MENRRIEYRNGQRLIAKMLDRGYECFIPIFDAGIDYIFFNPQEFRYLNVQLKSQFESFAVTIPPVTTLPANGSRWQIFWM